MKAPLQDLVKPAPQYNYVPPELELYVKGLYNSTCVINGNNYSWGTRMVGLPGLG